MNNSIPNNGSISLMSDFSMPAAHTPSYGNNGSSTMSPKRVKKFFKNSPLIPLIVVVVVVLVVAGFGISKLFAGSNSQNTVLSANTKTAIDKPVASEDLNRTFNFPLKDGTGKVVSQLTYVIQSVELRNEIIVKGQKATAVAGRTFLIINLKITNSYDKSVQLNSKDYIRLMAGSSSEKLAADIHNDPVDVQAISTKYTRLGFPINDNERNLTLQVGEIAGAKQTIALHLR